ncbi:MAG TPA: hypothetical protein VHS09_11890 [Polyangiaceae bacterium]|jgi:hypothetical protein|nr:hypothetical protein [Polyangiaceae bacterium]
MAAKRADARSEALDRLYAAPFDAFLPLRRELAASLRAAGDAASARAVTAAVKPTRTAWALDQIAHHRPELVAAMLGARDAAVAVQKKGDAGAMREAIRESRARTTEALHAARDVLASSGFAVPVAQLRRMGETLAAASVEGSEARRLFTEGRLTRDLGQEDPFAGLEAGPARPGKEAAPARDVGKATATAAAAAKEKAAKEKAAHEAVTKAARERVEALEAEVREARVEARKKEMAAVRAQDEADRARRAVGEVEERLEGARGELRALRA